MSRVIRFLVLAAIGFALGAGLAYFQASQQKPVPQVEERQQQTAQEAATQPAQPEAQSNTENNAATETSQFPQDIEQPSAEAGEVPGSSVGGVFTLTDHNGQTVTEKSWPGKHTLVFFGFTHCPDICPTTLDKISQGLNALSPEYVQQLQPLFITTDPARDTAEVIKAYLGNYTASFVGLTGTEEQVKAAQAAYKVYAAKTPGADENSYLMDHSAYVYLMSPEGNMVEIFGKDATAEDIVVKLTEYFKIAQAPVAVEPPTAEPADTAPVTEMSDQAPEEAMEPAPTATP